MKTILLALSALFCFGIFSTASAYGHHRHHHYRDCDESFRSARCYGHHREYYRTTYYDAEPAYYYDAPRYYYYRPVRHHYYRRPSVAVSFGF